LSSGLPVQGGIWTISIFHGYPAQATLIPHECITCEGVVWCMYGDGLEWMVVVWGGGAGIGNGHEGSNGGRGLAHITDG